jgi:hypothetical protein
VERVVLEHHLLSTYSSSLYRKDTVRRRLCWSVWAWQHGGPRKIRPRPFPRKEPTNASPDGVPMRQDFEKWSADSGSTGRNGPDQVVGSNRIGWSDGTGFSGRIRPEYARSGT